MSVDLEYAIKKDIRNNPVIREVDGRERREFRRVVWLAAFGVAMVLFSAWEHFRVVQDGYAIEQLQQQRVAEESINRQLKLNLETLQSPQVIDQRARTELGLQQATSKETLVLEGVHAAPPAPGVVAEAR